MLNFPVHKYYNSQNKQLRLLWHQTLGEIIRYPELPRECLNFDVYPIFTPKISRQKTIESQVITRHQRYISDCVVTEMWFADDLSMRAGFFYELMRFFTESLDEGDHLVWFPKDKGWRAYCVEPVDLYCGDSSNQSVNPVHTRTRRDYRWLKSEVKFEFQILKLYDTPEIINYFEGI
jgi:hypothetical protein